jgi:hypothetical protein
MKIQKTLLVAIALGLGWPAVSNGDDQDQERVLPRPVFGWPAVPNGANRVVQFRLSWHGTFYTTNALGTIGAGSFSERDFVQKVAMDNGLDPSTLVFVYRAVKHDTAVVRLADGGFIADVLQMEYDFTEVTNKNRTRAARQAILYNEIDGSGAHGSPLGSAFGLQEAQRNSKGDVIAYGFHGTFQYSIDGVVYTGTFATGTQVRDTSRPAQ